MRLARPQNRSKSEGTITLINVVFLMLIFFLIAGSLTPPLDNDITLISAENGQPLQPPDTISVRSDGQIFFRGALTTAETYLTGLQQNSDSNLLTIRIISDKELPASKLIDVVSTFRGLGVSSVRVVTERADP